jgi:murein DD-endopeptidase MepM/ murein hydrolase activator NlpD
MAHPTLYAGRVPRIRRTRPQVTSRTLSRAFSRISSSLARHAGCFVVALSLGAPLVAQHAGEPRAEPIKNVFWQPDQLQQGSPMFITCELSGAAARVTGVWRGKKLTFFRTEKPRLWYALAGVDLDTQPGPYDLKISALMRTGKWASSVKSVTVEPGNFSAGNVQVPEQYVQPSPEERKQIERDAVFKKRAFAREIRMPLWSGGFSQPIDAPSTPSFGETRLMNEEKTSRHLGTDYPAKEGTPVRASNSGVVVLARSLFYEGNCVIINHGQRFFTVYMHLSRIDVREGRRVRKEQRIGLSGATGRVTGPHLHFEAEWDGIPVDPLQLLHLTLPDLTPAERRRAQLVEQRR